MTVAALRERRNEELQASRQRPSSPSIVAWIGGWLCILAISAWAAQLSIWLIVAAPAAAVWTWSAARCRAKWPVVAAALLWAAIGTGAGIEYRVWQMADHWPRLQLQIENRAAASLNDALDELVRRGQAAVAGVDAAIGETGAVTPSAQLFTRFQAVVAGAGVSAVAIFDSLGAPIAWAGEHRGMIPLSVRRGASRYSFHEGPLFSYLYFSRPARGERTAVAAVLLESNLPTSEGLLPFAARFASRHGVTPVFALPDQMQGPSIWDWTADEPILSVRFDTLTQQRWWERVVGRGRWGVGLLWFGALAVLVGGWYRSRRGASSLPVAVVTAALLVMPLGTMFNAEDLFSPLQFVLPLPWDMSLGMLLVLLLGSAIWMLTRVDRWPRPIHVPWWATTIVVLVYVPLALEVVRRSAAGGLLAGRPGGGFALQLALALLLAIPFFLLIRVGEGRAGRPGTEQKVALVAAGACMLLFALATVLAWTPSAPLAWWLAGAWAVPFGLLAWSLPFFPSRHPALRAWLVAGCLAAVVALPQLWVLHEGAKLESAERELDRLGTNSDPFLDFLLRQLAERAEYFAQNGETGVNLLYHSWVASGLAREGYEARLTIWRDGQAGAELRLDDLAEMPEGVPEAVVRAAGITAPVVELYTQVEGLHYLLLAPLSDGRILSVAVPPRSRLGRATALARFLHPDGGSDQQSSIESLYLVRYSPDDSLPVGAGSARAGEAVQWEAAVGGWRSDAPAHFPGGWMHVHLFVRTASLSILMVRAVLMITVLLGVLLACWVCARLIRGEVPAYLMVRREWIRSFRGRIVLALFAFFLLPTAIFGAVAYGAVSREVFRSAAGLARRALEQAARELDNAPLAQVGTRIGADLLLYRHGALSNAAATEVLDLGLFDAWLPPDIYLRVATGQDLEQVAARRLGQNDYLVAYRHQDAGLVLAAPIPLASDEITRRQTEFRDIALLMSLVGAALSTVLSLLVGRTLTRPIDELSRGAAAVGSGNLRLRLPEERPDEFGGVYLSFNRMVDRLRQARSALLRETRRTETIVAEAATGVLALDSSGSVELVNPRAAQILGASPRVGAALPRVGPLLTAVADAFETFWQSGAIESAAELQVEGRLVRLRLRRLSVVDGSTGAVLALEDITAEVRTARVLAWGEMARQVAHEIKNPLTPIKLAVQHLRRAYADRRPDYGEILDRNVDAILGEIDRLGEIARAFSRFGTPPITAERLERVDVVSVVNETLALYRGAGHGVAYSTDFDPAAPVGAMARVGELKEVMVNLLENAREALDGHGQISLSVSSGNHAGRVEIAVSDTGEGIPADLLPHVFDPHFSTRTRGTGLGLAISKRLVESWGGEIRARSRPGQGTTVTLLLVPADLASPA